MIEEISKELDLNFKSNNLYKGLNFVNTYTLQQSITEGGIIGCLTGICKDSLAQGYSYEAVEKSFRMKKHPLYFNVDIAFICAFQGEAFLDGLDILFSIAGFLNSKSIFEIEDNLTTDPNFSKQKIAVKVHDYTKEELNNIWSNLGINYMPAIFCNFASIIVTDDKLGQIVPRVEKYHYEAKSIS